MISVVIPTCRRPDLLGRCLDRLAPGVQTLLAEEYEVIVTDDGVPTVEQFVAEKYPWAKWVAGPRRGPASNRNNGVRHAQGEWIAFTDDDCVPSAGWLARFVKAMRGDCQVYEGKTTCEAGITSPMMQAPVNLTGGCLWSCNMMIRSEVFRNLGGFDEGYLYPHLEDVDLRDRLLQRKHAVEFVSTAVVDHPPRPMTPPWRLSKYHESWLYRWYKNNHRKYGTPRLLYVIVRTRLRTLCQYRLSRDTVRAVVAMCIEVFGILYRSPFWEHKFRSELDPLRRGDGVNDHG